MLVLKNAINAASGCLIYFSLSDWIPYLNLVVVFKSMDKCITFRLKGLWKVIIVASDECVAFFLILSIVSCISAWIIFVNFSTVSLRIDVSDQYISNIFCKGQLYDGYDEEYSCPILDEDGVSIVVQPCYNPKWIDLFLMHWILSLPFILYSWIDFFNQKKSVFLKFQILI